jgi:transcriptional regulator with XRE-family HTH domain
MNTAPMLTPPIGHLLRTWRTRRRLTQMELALDAEISTRHLSFLETGRSRPSRDMIERLADQLEIPLRERNELFLAAGFAPNHPERTIDDQAQAQVRAAIDVILTGHEPFPALAVDQHWNLVAANRATAPFFAGLDPSLTTPPINVLRATLHPGGVAPRIANLNEWRAHTLRRVHRQIERTVDPALIAHYDELSRYPHSSDDIDVREEKDALADLALTLRVCVGDRTLSLLYTTTLFGSPRDVTLSEIAIESFFPADAATAEALRSSAEATS